MSIKPTLQKMPIFEGFAEDEMVAIEHALSIDDYQDEHEFIREGDQKLSHSQDAMFILIEGEVNVMIRDKKSDTFHNVSTLKPGSVFGVMSLIAPGRRAATCLASGEVKAASMNKAAFDYLFNANVSLGARFQFALVRQLACDLRKANDQLYREICSRAKNEK